jgi:hypothetical protein
MIEAISQWIRLPLFSSVRQNVWGRFDHKQPVYDFGQIFMILAAAALAAAAGLVCMRLLRRIRTDSPQQLFRDLCRAHELTRSSRRLLKQLAVARKLSHPSALFVEPMYFEMSDLPPALQSARSDLQRLRDQLFK